MPSYDNTIGALVLCSWFNCALFTIEGMQAYEFFARFKNDSFINKFFVTSALLADSAGMIGNLAAVYLYCVTNFGDVAFAATQPWPLPMYVTAAGLSAAVTQSFLTLRIYRLTSQIAYPILFFALTAAMLGGAIGTSITVISLNSLADRSKLQSTVRVWLSCAAAVDILIALALVYILARTKSDFKDTSNIIKRLIYGSVKTGSLTAGSAVLSLIIYSLQPNANVHLFFSMSVGRLYSISMLYNLNSRHSNDGTSRGPSSGGEASSGQGQSEGRSKGGRSRKSTKGIKIQMETHTYVDDARDIEEQGDVIQLGERRQDRSTGQVPINESGMNAVPYGTPTAWDAESLDHKSLEHSQVDLVKEHHNAR